MEREARYQNIIVAVTESCDCEPAFERALKLAQAQGAALSLLDIADAVPDEARVLFPAEKLAALEASFAQERSARLARLRKRAAEVGVNFSAKSATGSPFRVAIRAVIADRHDLLVKTFDRSVAGTHSIRGSTDSHLLRKCPCALWLVHPDAAGSTRVLAAVNPDPADVQDNALSVDIVRAAATVAALDGAELHVLHAWKVFGEWLRGPPKPVESDPEVDYIVGRALTRHADFVADLMERAAPAGRSARTHVVHARAADAIIDFVRSQTVDLLVIGTVDRTGIPGLLIGSTAEQVLNEVTCSVLALKPHGFVSPVTLDS